MYVKNPSIQELVTKLEKALHLKQTVSKQRIRVSIIVLLNCEKVHELSNNFNKLKANENVLTINDLF